MAAIAIALILCPGLSNFRHHIDLGMKTDPYIKPAVVSVSPEYLRHCRLSPKIKSGSHIVMKTVLPRPTNVVLIGSTHIGQQGSAVLCLSTLQCFLSSIYPHFYNYGTVLCGNFHAVVH